VIQLTDARAARKGHRAPALTVHVAAENRRLDQSLTRRRREAWADVVLAMLKGAAKDGRSR
jgi:hypothetical protein